MKIVSSRGRLKTNANFDEVQELMKCKDDPVYFISKYVKHKHPAIGSIAIDMHPYKEDYLHFVQKNPHTIAMMARQAGLTHTSAMFMLWQAIFSPNKVFMLIGDGQFSSNVHDMISFAIANLPNFLSPGMLRYSRSGFEFVNGSRVMLSMPSTNAFRGRTLASVYLDNFAFLQPDRQNDLWASLIPSIYTGTSIIVSSTPNTNTDFFANLWTAASTGKSSFKAFKATVDQCPQFDANFKTMMRKAIGTSAYRREYECEFE